MTNLDRDRPSVDALLMDGYLDALLAGLVLASGDERAGSGDTRSDRARRGDQVLLSDRFDALDPAIRLAAARLRRDLTRVHPSFRFEERLAARLAEAAVAMRMPLAAAGGGSGRIVPFPSPTDDPAGELSGAGAGPDLDLPLGPSPRDRSRPLLIGGALTSAALSLAGAAWVAWRLGRPARPSTAMGRAARTVRIGRSTDGRRPATGRARRRSVIRTGRGLD
jgi:hypothetical protein